MSRDKRMSFSIFSFFKGLRRSAAPPAVVRIPSDVIERGGLVVEGRQRSIRFKDGESWVHFSFNHCVVYPKALVLPETKTTETYDDDGILHRQEIKFVPNWYRIKPSIFNALWDAVISDRNPLRALATISIKKPSLLDRIKNIFWMME